MSRFLRLGLRSNYVRALMLISLVASPLEAAEPQVKLTFPRLAGYQIGATPYDGYSDPEYQRAMAKLDLVILGGAAPTSAAAAIKKQNPDTLVGKYSVLVSVNQTAKAQADLRNKADNESGPNALTSPDWWARDLNGDRTSTWPNTWTVNHTEFVKPDAQGDRWPQWKAKYEYAKAMKDPSWDFWFSDSVYWRPRKTDLGIYPEWAGGVELEQADMLAAYRRGHRAHWNQIKRLTPDKLIVANLDWYRSDERLPEYDQQIHGGLLERILEETDYVDRRRHPWDQVMRYYRRTESYLLDPQLIIFVAQGSPTNYRFFRYAFATCLMGNGYFDYAPIRYHYGTVEWFDEFDVAGTQDTGWLGRALDPMPTSPWKNDVWRRDFEGGVALVNPIGNGTRTVTVEAGFRRIQGRQDPTVNNGKEAGTITLADGDGMILVRDSERPNPPNLTIEH